MLRKLPIYSRCSPLYAHVGKGRWNKQTSIDTFDASRLVRKIRNRERARNFHQIIFYVLIENSPRPACQ